MPAAAKRILLDRCAVKPASLPKRADVARILRKRAYLFPQCLRGGLNLYIVGSLASAGTLRPWRPPRKRLRKSQHSPPGKPPQQEGPPIPHATHHLFPPSSLP